MRDETEQNASAPLRGVTVVDFTHGVAGPYASMVLGDLGAEVWKIEKPERGDPTRYMNVSERFVADIPRSGGDYFLAINRNKKSVAINLQSEDGRRLALGLVAKADIVVSNFRPGVMERLGLSYRDCREVNEAIIYASLSAYGQSGPMADQPGMDVAVQARSGVMSITGHGTGGPVKPGTSVADFGGGAQLAIAILGALYRRQVTGAGGELHVSLLDSMMSMLINYSVAVLDGDAHIEPLGSGHPQLVPFQAFPSADGYIVIATGTNRLFRELCRVLGRPDLAEDPKFRTNPDRVANRAEIVAQISDAITHKTTREWLDVFEREQIPCAPVNTLQEAFADEQLIAQGMVSTIAHPSYGTIHQIGSPFTFNAKRPALRMPPPLLGEHTEEVFDVTGLGAASASDGEAAGVRDDATA